MPVDSIGTVLNPPTTSPTAQSAIRQEDFIRLFMAQLQFQDPLEPVDNREFLAQLAQFSSLEQSRITSENTNSMLSMDSRSQALSLLQQMVDVRINGSQTVSGKVIAVQFTAEGPRLSVDPTPAGMPIMTDVRLAQIGQVTQTTTP